MPVNCSIHPWMNGLLIIKDHPYVAITSEDGSLEIANLPTGKWEFQAWHSKSGYLDEVSRNGSSEKWSKGKFDVAVEEGDNDFGEVTLSADLFKG